MSEIENVMQTLTAQWYNALVTGLGLSDQSFQLYQGPNSMVTSSQPMWNIFNAVPPEAVNNYYNPTQANNFAQDYNSILSALIASSDSDFQSCMGDYYADWMSYFKTHEPTTWDATGISNLFTKWAIMNAPGKQGCVTGLTKAFINPINAAIQMFANANGSYAWNQTIDALQKALAGGASKSFRLDSLKSSSDIKHTWAKATTSIFFNIFSFGGGANYDNMSTKAFTSGLKISASFNKVTTFAAGPYAQSDPNNLILAKFNPWYNSAVLSLAYTSKDNKVWNNQSPITWEKAFGSAGFLQRMTTALVVADDISISMTSSASFSSSEQEQIMASAQAGIWPFFRVSGGGGSTSLVTFNESGQFTSVTTIPAGNPQILGILQSPMSSIF
jgi:hypothetical protein